jgi:hypothetical protein
MFLPNSRYASVATIETTTATGEPVLALKRRPLGPLGGMPTLVQSGDRLDLFAFDTGGDATRFWAVADANTALDARTLVAQPGAMLDVPQA